MAARLLERRDEIEASAARYLAASPGSNPSHEDEDAARRLLDVVIASLSDADNASRPCDERVVARHYLSRFGDGLVPILKDVLGGDLPSSFLSRCIAGYGHAVRRQNV